MGHLLNAAGDSTCRSVSHPNRPPIGQDLLVSQDYSHLAEEMGRIVLGLRSLQLRGP